MSVMCPQGNLDIGLLEIASASKMYPLAILQYFPTLISNPEATLATMARKHMSTATRALLGFALPPGSPHPVTYQRLPLRSPGSRSHVTLPAVDSAENVGEFGTPQATPGTPRRVRFFSCVVRLWKYEILSVFAIYFRRRAVSYRRTVLRNMTLSREWSGAARCMLSLQVQRIVALHVLYSCLRKILLCRF